MRFNEARKIIDFRNKVEKVVGDFYTIAGVEAINHYTQNFRKQGFDDDGVKPWQPRKRTRLRDSGKAILVQSGALRRSLIRRRAGKSALYIMSPLKYANVHNSDNVSERRAGRGSFIMPKRQFVGESKKLSRTILRKIDKRVNNAFEFTR